jgi:hypothetical protein
MKVCTIFLAKNMLYTVIEYSCAEFTTNRFHSVKIVKESTICEQSQPNAPINVNPEGGGGRAKGGDLINQVVPWVGIWTDTFF